MIPYGRQEITEEDICAVEEVLRSDFLTQGPAVPNFEKVVAEYCGVNHAIAVNSATSALHIACMALDLGPGDWLWTSPNTFVASANCGRYCGASIDFVDINPHTYNMCVSALERKLSAAEKEGRLPKVVIPVHFAGQSCDMVAIHKLSQTYGFSIIEDASHSIGATFNQSKVGSCAYSDITVFSFHPVKIITTAEGGIATTNNSELAERMSRLRTHGITRDQMHMRSASEGLWYYEQLELGYNYRMTDIHAALGNSQMKRLDEYISRRHEIADRYDKMLTDFPVTKPYQSLNQYSALHLYPIMLDDSTRRKFVFESMRESGIGVNVHYIPVHLHPYYRQLGFSRGYCPAAEDFYDRAISLPMYPGLNPKQQDYVVQRLKEALS